MNIRGLGLSPAEVDDITKNLFGPSEAVSAPNQSTATQQVAPSAPGSTLTIKPSFIPVGPIAVRPIALNPLTATVKDNKRVTDVSAGLLKPTGPVVTQVAAKKSAAGPIAVGAGAGLLVAGPVGAAIGAGAGFLFSKLR